MIATLSLPFLAKKPIDLPPIISVELIQITDKTNIPFAPKAKKIIEKVKKKNEKLASEQAPPKKIKKEKNKKKVNLDGGALALGHPLGATGARITGKAAELLKRENKKYALSTQCIGLGMGIATIIESIN